MTSNTGTTATLPPRRAKFLCAALLSAVGMVTGCGKTERAGAPEKSVAAAKADAKQEERYPLTGQIVRIEAEKKVLVIRHDIPLSSRDFTV